MDHVEQFKATFFQECAERLSDLEAQLGELKISGERTEALHAAFRSVHSIKGGAGMFGFSRLVAFAHKFESVLDRMREGTVRVDDETVHAATRASDVMADLVAATQSGVELPAEFETAAVERLSATSGLTFEPQNDVPATEVAADTPRVDTAPRRYHLTFKPYRHMLRRASEPLLIITHLKDMGHLDVQVDTSDMPGFAELEPTDCYLSWEFTLETTASLDDISATFEFVEGDCTLMIEQLDAPASSGGRADRPYDPPTVSDLDPVLPAKDSHAAPETKQDSTPGSPASTPASAPLNRGVETATPVAGGTSVRVDLDRIDRLFDLVGEITVARALVAQHCNHDLMTSNPVLSQGLTQLLQLTASLHDNVMAIRAQPVRSIFSRMPRLVRDLAEKTGKNVRLEMSGEETEIDKTIIEELSDPLVHIIRNAVDHGIEPSDERRARGKQPQGTIRISAMQRGSRIIIEVNDDGRGIDREKVRQTAIRKKLVPPDARLTDEEIDNLVFLPGLSTSQSISDISGRGVGMDVVHRNLQRVGGRVGVRSEPGRGTTTTLTLPLTIAVMDGMTVRVDKERFVIPLGSIVECIAVPVTRVRAVPGAGEVINVRGRHVRITCLSGEEAASRPSDGSLLVILVESNGGAPTGVVVDEIVGQQQVVIKSIPEKFGNITGIAGATILGDGSVAMILDVGAVAEFGRLRNANRLLQVVADNKGRLVA